MRYPCTCGKSYGKRCTLLRHQRYDCGVKEREFGCHHCDVRFKYKFELIKHIRLKHNYPI